MKKEKTKIIEIPEWAYDNFFVVLHAGVQYLDQLNGGDRSKWTKEEKKVAEMIENGEWENK